MRIRSATNALTLLLALAGCIVAIVLTYEEFNPKADIGCSRFGGDCSKNLKSAYGRLGPVPTSLFGLAMYATVAGICIRRRAMLRRLRLAATLRYRPESGPQEIPLSGSGSMSNSLADPQDSSRPDDGAEAPVSVEAPAVPHSAPSPEGGEAPIPSPDYGAAAGAAAEPAGGTEPIADESAAESQPLPDSSSPGDPLLVPAAYAPPDSGAPAPTHSPSLRRLDAALWLISLSAVAISWWLQNASLYELCSFCPWCFASAVIVTLMLPLTSYDYLLAGRPLEGEQKLLIGVSAFILICFGFVASPVLVSRILVCRPRVEMGTNRQIPLTQRDIIVVDKVHEKGDPKAKYLLVEFADYTCTHCKEASAIVEKILKSPPAGGVRLAFRNFPLEGHPWAQEAARAAEAAGEQGKFWEMHDKLFARQEEMTKPTFTRETFDEWAEELKLDLKRFSADFDDVAIAEKIARDHVAGDLTKLQSTPTFYLVTPTKITQLTGVDAIEKVWSNKKDPAWQ